MNDDSVPHRTQRLGSPRGYSVFDFDGPTYVDTYRTFNAPEDKQLHAPFSTPRFRDWVEDLFAYADLYSIPSDVVPPAFPVPGCRLRPGTLMATLSHSC